MNAPLLAFVAKVGLVPLEEAKAQSVHVTMADADADFTAYIDAAEWEASKRDNVSLQAVRAALSTIEGTVSDAVFASRGERD